MVDVRTTCMLRRMVWRCAASRSTRRAFWPASSASKHAASVKAAYLMWPCGRLFPAGMRRAIRLTSDLRPVPPEPKEKNTASFSIFLRRLRLRVHSSIEACCCWPFDDGTARRSLYKKLLQYWQRQVASPLSDISYRAYFTINRHFPPKNVFPRGSGPHLIVTRCPPESTSQTASRLVHPF